MNDAEDLVAMGRLLEAIRPWHRHLVIVGGWAHQLHRLHPLATVPPHDVLRTGDADIAVPIGERIDGDIAAALKAAKFVEVLSTEHTPPVAEYHLGSADSPFYAEFLANLSGSEYKRGKRDATLQTAGISAQKLRHLDLLVESPWGIALDESSRPPLAKPARILVPNPVSFIAQKILIRNARPPDKQAQDILYIHDTLELFGGALDKLRALWESPIRPFLPPKTARDVVRLQGEYFASVTDTIRTAARMPQDRALTAEHIQQACAYGLGEIFGGK